MDKVTAKKVVSGTKVRYAYGAASLLRPRGIAVVYGIDEGPGTDPLVKYPLFDLRFEGAMGYQQWVSYRLLEIT